MQDDELYHYGVKGMRWGVRKFRERAKQRRMDRQARRSVKNDRKYAEKNVSLLSDAELNARINRLQRERQLKDLSSQELRPGRRKAGQMLDRYGSQALGAVVGIGVSATVGKYLNANMERTMAKQGYYSKHYGPDGNIKHDNSDDSNNGKKKRHNKS